MISATLAPRTEPVAAGLQATLDAHRREFLRSGSTMVPGLLDAAEVAEIRELFAGINAEEQAQMGPEAAASADPLTRYPRIMHPHRTNARARHYLLHPRVWTTLEALFGEEPLAAQSMFYFKPPGARGQAMHQDQFYLMVQPGTCIAAWTAIDDCDAENGAMYVVPETGDAEVVCPGTANPEESFTTHFVPVPKGRKAQLVKMKAGDTLFFNGSALHGSGPNRTKDRFRRAFIGHYAAGSTDKIASHYLPLVRKDGSDVEVTVNAAGGPCGTGWAGGAH